MDNIKNILNNVIGQMASRQELPPDKIQRVWNAAVGEKAMAHMRVVDFKKGVLVVHVDTAAWLYQIKTQQKSITGRLQEGIPEFQQLVLKIGKVV